MSTNKIHSNYVDTSFVRFVYTRENVYLLTFWEGWFDDSW